jgi:hypothetical protein
MITQSLQKPFFLERKTDTPQVEWCPQESVLKMTGRSLPENAEAFYKPVLDWIREYIPTAAEKTILRVELEYFNSSSVKQLLSILIKLEDLRVMGKEVEVVWVYNQDDELMEMKGRELESIVELPFRFENFIL